MVILAHKLIEMSYFAVSIFVFKALRPFLRQRLRAKTILQFPLNLHMLWAQQDEKLLASGRRAGPLSPTYAAR